MMNELWIVSTVVLWVIVVGVVFLLAGALRQIGILELRLGDDPGALISGKGLDRGTIAPEIIGIDLETGAERRLSTFPQRARVLVFLSTTCFTCERLVPHINEVMATRASEFDWLVVCQGTAEECRAFKKATKLNPPVLVDSSREAERSFEVTLTPFAYLLDWEGRVVIRGVVNNWRQLEMLLDQEGTLEPTRAATTSDQKEDVRP